MEGAARRRGMARPRRQLDSEGQHDGDSTTMDDEERRKRDGDVDVQLNTHRESQFQGVAFGRGAAFAPGDAHIATRAEGTTGDQTLPVPDPRDAAHREMDTRGAVQRARHHRQRTRVGTTRSAVDDRCRGHRFRLPELLGGTAPRAAAWERRLPPGCPGVGRVREGRSVDARTEGGEFGESVQRAAGGAGARWRGSWDWTARVTAPLTRFLTRSMA